MFITDIVPPGPVPWMGNHGGILLAHRCYLGCEIYILELAENRTELQTNTFQDG